MSKHEELNKMSIKDPLSGKGDIFLHKNKITLTRLKIIGGAILQNKTPHKERFAPIFKLNIRNCLPLHSS